jgi:hypothetical protein
MKGRREVNQGQAYVIHGWRGRKDMWNGLLILLMGYVCMHEKRELFCVNKGPEMSHKKDRILMRHESDEAN